MATKRKEKINPRFHSNYKRKADGSGQINRASSDRHKEEVFRDRERAMEGSHIPEVMLNSGFTMPIVGLGTGASPTPAPEVVYRAVLAAIETGYRHFDTAAFYESEEPLGKAIRDALDQGLVGSRDQLFVTSKLWAADAYPEGVLPALRKTLA